MTIKKRLEVIEQKILIKDFEQQTSKKAIWKNKETKAYILWKEERGEIKKESPSDVEEQTERIIAKSVKNSLLIATPNETEEMLIYQDGIFIGGKIALSKIKQVIKEKANKAYSTDRRGKIKPYYLSIAIQKMIIDFIKSFSCCPLDDFDANERIINLKNGLYYLDGFQGVIPNPRTEDGHYDTKEDKKDSNKERPSMRPDEKEGHGKTSGDKDYYGKAYGDPGYASDLVTAQTKIASLDTEVQNLKTEKRASKLADRALHLARVSASRGIIPFDLSNIEKQAKEYIKLDENGVRIVTAQLEALPVVDRRALEA
ncbi:hypothetical protein LCGC14_1653130, partial [marine sediment metagenome]